MFEGRVSNRFKQTFVKSILKEVVSENAISFTPISLTSALSEIFEKVVGEKLRTYLSETAHCNHCRSDSEKNFENRCSFVCDWN